MSFGNIAAARTAPVQSYLRYRPAQLVVVAALLYLAAYSIGLIVRPGEGYLRIQSNLIYNLAPLAALILSAVAIRRGSGRERLGWICLAGVLLTWQIGDWTFTYYDFVKNSSPPFPGISDAAYYPGYFAFIVAIPLLIFPEQRLKDSRWLFDAAIIVVISGALGWQYIMRPTLADGGAGVFAGAVALGYPLLDLAILTALVVTLYASGWRYSVLALVLTGAAFFQIASDVVYSYVLNTTGYDNVGNPVELGWLVAYLLIATSFVLPREAAQTQAGRHATPSIIGLALPYALSVPLIALVVVTAAQGSPPLVLLGGAIAAVALVVARQALTLQQNYDLLVRTANYDDLTDLPNRHRFRDVLSRVLSSQRDPEGALALLALDDFKAVNDSLGHDIGDQVLTRVAGLLQERMAGDERAARVGGDEFALVLSDVDPARAEALVQQLLRDLQERPFLLDGQLVRVSASAGIAVFGQHGSTESDLLASADLALLEAKALGGNKARLFEPGHRARALTEARLRLKERISEALEEDRFVLHCQPIVNLATGRCSDYEVLVRMLDDQGEPMLPAAFLDVAERVGLIQEIDRWVVRRALRLLAAEQRRGRATRFAVNLSGKAFEDPALKRLIRGELGAGMDATGIVFEVTETAAIANLDKAQAFIGDLKELGCRFALDDFGVGFSSFSQLKNLPVDILKIDGSFIRHLPADEVDQHLVRAIVALARGLRLETVAEFVQDEATVGLLGQIGVDYGQGYYLGRPAPVEELLAGGSDISTRRAA